MKRTILIGLAGLLALPLLVLSPVFAHEGEDHGDTAVSSEPEKPQKTQEQRVADRKAKLEAKLTQLQQTQVKGRCQAASAIVKNVQKRVSTFETKRPDLYSNLVTRFRELGPKLEAAEVDTKTYDQQVTELEKKVTQFDTKAADLKLAVDDLATLDCAGDPEGFAATVKEAVVIRQDVIKLGREIRTYLRETLKPTLTQIQNQLSAKQEGED